MLEFSLLNNWAFQPETWLILGILLILTDLLFGLNYFLLPLGIGAFLTALMVMLSILCSRRGAYGTEVV